jgi:hypothetical protein
MNLVQLHGAFMGLGFVCMASAIIIAHYFRSKKWWLKAHRALNIAAPILAALGIILAIIMVTPAYGVQLPLVHHVLGLVTLVLLILEPIMGFSIFKTKDKQKIASLKKSHRILGRITPLMYIVTIIAIEVLLGG